MSYKKVDYKKVVERLVSYKLSKGEACPYSTDIIDDIACSAPIYIAQKSEPELGIWAGRLEEIVRMRHSKFKINRKLSRLKK